LPGRSGAADKPSQSRQSGTLRHTCASRLFAQGRNAMQVQRWLRHQSTAFTLSVYVHLLDDDLGGPPAAPDSTVPAAPAVSAKPAAVVMTIAA
jgi:integrase